MGSVFPDKSVHLGFLLGRGEVEAGMEPGACCHTKGHPNRAGSKLSSDLFPLSSPRDPTNIQILQAFVACHQFANLNLVQALR